MDKEKSLSELNALIEINNDRIEGYDSAIKETDETDLKNMFTQFMQTSQKCKQELVSEVQKLGGKPEEGTKTTGKLYRLFMDLKSAMTGKDREAILNSCEYGEDVAVDTYKDCMKDNSECFTPEQQSMLKKQYEMIKADHDKVRSMRDASKGKD
ncbi:MAG: PA2169 family four-helix-bundle protein [Bacteroidota bacterium]|nr:PA2169 family four-helix-bundle protein [Bacteroidota bacterium]